MYTETSCKLSSNYVLISVLTMRKICSHWRARHYIGSYADTESFITQYTTTVSYTHLDVYKRQLDNLAILVSGGNGADDRS